MRMHFRLAAVFCCITFARLFAQDNNQPLPFRAAIELALRNSASNAAALADVQRARATVAQAKDFYIPQVVVGSGIGYSHGFPLTLEGAAPSIFNVNVQ